MDALTIVDHKLYKCCVTVEPATVIRDERQSEIAVTAQPLDQIGFGSTRKRRNENVPDRERVFRALRPDHHDSRIPGAIFVPRRNSSAFIGCLPARWTSVSRTAPSPQAMVSRSSSTVPGAPEPSPRVERSTLMR